MKFTKTLLLSLLFGFAVLLVLLFLTDFHKLLDHLTGFHWHFLILALLLALLNYFLRFLRWEYYLHCLKIPIAKRKSFVIFFTGLALSITPGKVGDGVKSLLLKTASEIPLARSLPILFLERLLDVLGVIILLSFGLQIFQQGFPIFLLSLGISLLIILLFLKGPTLLSRTSVPERVKKWLKVFMESGSLLLSLRHFIPMLFLTLLAWFSECLAFFLILKGFGPEINPVLASGQGSGSVTLLYATFTYALSTLAGAITLLPGGLGATEASLLGLLLLRGIPKPLAVGSTLLVRLATLWFAVLLGGAIFLLNRKTLSPSPPD